MKYGFVAKYQAIWLTRTMCRLLGVSSSGFYDWRGRPVSAHERENIQLLKAMKHSHEACDGTYGSPRVVRDLIDAGFSCSENRVARLRKAAGIKARHKRRRALGQLDSPIHAIALNLLGRQFEATSPNQTWAADFTYVWTGEGWLFVAVVLDLYSRRALLCLVQQCWALQQPVDAVAVLAKPQAV